MHFSKPALIALTAAGAAHAAAIDKRQVTEDTFKCKPGFELTAYTTAGVGTCTKIEGSAILPGYAGQTVVVVGLISGLTGLIVATLPLTKYLAKSGLGYFKQPNSGQQWTNAFPRRSEDDDSFDLQGHLETIWSKAHGDLQSHDHDPNSVVSFYSNSTSAGAKYTHGDFDHTHHFEIVPHNSTHDTYTQHYEIVSNKLPEPGALAKRTPTWTGARVVVDNPPVHGQHNPPALSQELCHSVAASHVFRYITAVQNNKLSQACGMMGSAPHAHKHFALQMVITSQENGGAYEASECDPFINDYLPNDEL